ncbi:hypothetical protein I3843_08G069100 [Carya illinoinensis]|uniref:Uncharacterized protein n=1 Tax=Carya illinoinensis TaxID=32201 RepID=A0A922E9P2_CARIL|nr:hypothetical protein I3760_08G070800 [Carya illinoinensis]KAG6699514.1 hypothetical protein I3842_08G070500 [Carya illinoinensis]KAG7966845.1 hypothetical protein I3843_08G069100 [Carya illinoinensis]
MDRSRQLHETLSGLPRAHWK